MKYLNLAIALFVAVFLNGCLEVEDSDNSEIQTLLDNQTQTLAETKKVSIKGVVVDALDSTPVDAALITVLVGSEAIISDFSVTGGEFELTELPVYSDIDIIISSPDNKFLPRTFFKQTSYAGTEGITDFGNFAVSEGIEIQVSVIDNKTTAAFAGLEFIAYSHSGSNSSAYKYKHVSSYDNNNGLYSIILPKFIDTSISASLDFDRDGKLDYVPELSGYLRGQNLYIGSANNQEYSTIYINEVEEATDIEIRLSLVSESAESILGATFFVEDNIVDSSYDEQTNQYVIATKIKDILSIQLPAFTSGEVYYQSSVVTVKKLPDGNLNIIKNGDYQSCCFTIPNTKVIDFALSPQVLLESEAPLEVVLASSEVNSSDSSFSAFYSQAVEVQAENVSLTDWRGFTVQRGNDDANDLILPGTTIISGGVSIPVTFSLSLNDTRLTLTPASELVAGESYKYEVSAVTNLNSQEKEDIDGDELVFTVESDETVVFDPADMKLDNENYTTNGVVITPSNTAGEVANPSNNYNNISLYLPKSINSLQNLTLRQVSVIKNGVASVDIQNYTLVVDGEINVPAVGVVSLAQNENVSREGHYFRDVIVNSAQPEAQKVYRYNLWLYSTDNTALEPNNISFEYSFETKAGEVTTGNITLAVQ